MVRVVFLSALLLTTVLMPAFDAAALDNKRSDAVAAAVEVIVLRSTLAKNFVRMQESITDETVASVCNAITDKSREIMDRDGLIIRYAAVKYRDPANVAGPDEVPLLEAFEVDRKLKQRWDTVERDGKRYQRYSRPIFIEKACLACHGPKDTRPAAIVKSYPDDKAYDFQEGELRGMVSVLLKE